MRKRWRDIKTKWKTNRLKENLATENVARAEIHTTDSRKDLTQAADPENTAQVENPAKVSGSDERDDHEFERIARPIQNPVKEDEAATPLDKRDEVTERANAAANTTPEEKSSSFRSQIENALGGKNSQAIQIGSREAMETPTASKDSDGRGAIKE